MWLHIRTPDCGCMMQHMPEGWFSVHMLVYKGWNSSVANAAPLVQNVQTLPLSSFSLSKSSPHYVIILHPMRGFAPFWDPFC